MKTKVVLSLLVVFMAVGSAVASLVLTEQPIWVKAKLSPAAEPQCLNAQASCDDQGTEACIIQVAGVQAGPTTTANTFTDNCEASMLKNSTATPEASPLQVYELEQ